MKFDTYRTIRNLNLTELAHRPPHPDTNNDRQAYLINSDKDLDLWVNKLSSLEFYDFQQKFKEEIKLWIGVTKYTLSGDRDNRIFMRYADGVRYIQHEYEKELEIKKSMELFNKVRDERI